MPKSSQISPNTVTAVDSFAPKSVPNSTNLRKLDRLMTTSIQSQIHNTNHRVTSSKTRLINLNDSNKVRITSSTGTPRCVKGSINHLKADASCSGVVVAKQRLALWKISCKQRVRLLRIVNPTILRIINRKIFHVLENESSQKYILKKLWGRREYLARTKELTVKVRHADVLPTDNPFLVSCKGPNFIITCEYPARDWGDTGQTHWGRSSG